MAPNRMNPLSILTSYFFKKSGRRSSGLYSTFLQKYFPLASSPVCAEEMVTEIGGNVRLWGKSITSLQVNVPQHSSTGMCELPNTTWGVRGLAVVSCPRDLVTCIS
jgi:hypothetical protein